MPLGGLSASVSFFRCNSNRCLYLITKKPENIFVSKGRFYLNKQVFGVGVRVNPLVLAYSPPCRWAAYIYIYIYIYINIYIYEYTYVYIYIYIYYLRAFLSLGATQIDACV